VNHFVCSICAVSFDSLTKYCSGETFVQQLFVIHSLCFWTKLLVSANQTLSTDRTDHMIHKKNILLNQYLLVSVNQIILFVNHLCCVWLRKIDSKESFVCESFSWYCLCWIFL